MNVTSVVHVVGTIALIIILFTTILYTSVRTNSLIYENERKTLQRISNSIAYQALNALVVETNTSVLLNYPVEAVYGRAYNVIISSGSRIMSMFGHVKGLNPTYVYVLAIDPQSLSYAYTILYRNVSERPLRIVEHVGGRSCSSRGLILFSSETITYILKYEYRDYVEMRCELRGLKAR